MNIIEPQEGAIEGADAPSLSEDAIALDFAEVFKDELRYVAAWGKWFSYDGNRWAPDDTLLVSERVRRVCREYAAGSNDSEGRRSRLASAATAAAVERLARCDRRLAATVDQWDTDPWLLNTPDGPVHLRTGVQSGHYSNYHFTKITAVSPAGDCPIWHGVLDRITDRDVELQRYLARLFG